MSDTAETSPHLLALMADVEHHSTLASHHATKADEAIRRLSQLMGGTTTAATAQTANRRIPRCVSVWTDYLASHGPSLRQDIEDGTDTRFTERGYPYTVEWERHMAGFPDDHFPDDQIVRIRTVKSPGERGGAPVAFFLWAQRWGVHELFGVGPTHRITPDEPTTITGVIRPPTSVPTSVPVVSDGTFDEPDGTDDEPDETDTVERFETVEQWHAVWDKFLDDLLAADPDAIPFPSEKEQMLDTLPEDVDKAQGNEILATTMRDARVRSRENT